MKKEDILNEVTSSIKKELKNKSVNSMGVSEKYYNPYYLIRKCFNDFNELEEMNEKQLNNLLRLADFAADVFY